MNCCKNNNPEEKNLPTESVDQQNTHDHNDAKASKHSHKNHFLHLALCCGLPLLLLVGLAADRLSRNPAEHRAVHLPDHDVCDDADDDERTQSQREIINRLSSP